MPCPQTPKSLHHPGNTRSDSTSPGREITSATIGALSPRPAVPRRTVKIGKAMRERRQSSRYMGLVTWTTIESWHEDYGEDDKSTPCRRGNIQVRLPFSSVEVDFQYTHFMGSPSYALNINHIIDRSSELGRKIADLISGDRDLLELKKLLSNRELSLYSVVWNEANLFYVSSSAHIHANVWSHP